MAVGVNLLNAVFVLLGGYVAITYLFPFLRDFLSGILKNDKVTDGLMGIFNIYVIVFVLSGVVNSLVAINHPTLNYVNALIPGLNVLTSLIPYLQYLVLGAFIVAGLNSFRK
tara:strand:- start:280 stop:615 length:336 start_codon:yes stop_codon:yes gene_type:complete